MLPGRGIPSSLGGKTLVAYHREDVTHWFRSRQACEAALGKRPWLTLEQAAAYPNRKPSPRGAGGGVR